MSNNIKYPRLTSAQVIKPIARPGRFTFSVTSKIELDKKNPISKKEHQLIHQQGSHYGTVGDCCEYLTHEQLFDLAKQGFVLLRNTQHVILTF